MTSVKIKCQFSSRWYLRAGKSYALRPVSQTFPPTLHLKRFQCSSDWRWSSLVLSRKIVLLSTALSSRRSVVWCPCETMSAKELCQPGTSVKINGVSQGPVWKETVSASHSVKRNSVNQGPVWEETVSARDQCEKKRCQPGTSVRRNGVSQGPVWEETVSARVQCRPLSVSSTGKRNTWNRTRPRHNPMKSA